MSKMQNIFMTCPAQIVNAREGVEKKGTSYTVGRNVNWCSSMEEYEGSLKN